MDDREVGRYWDANAKAWTQLARAGHDVYRDHLNTPAFFALLPDVAGRSGLDVGCGEGHNTRLLAGRGARMAAIDIARTFVRAAAGAADGAEAADGADGSKRIQYAVASALDLPFGDGVFDFVTAFMCLMDVPEIARVLAEAHRVLRPGGFLQFSIEHPCFQTPHRRNLRGPDGRTYAFEVGDYFRELDGEISEWLFRSAPPQVREGLRPFRIPRFTRTLSEWVNLLIDTGFVVERMVEPRPSEETVRAYPKLQDAQVVAYFLHVRCGKPA